MTSARWIPFVVCASLLVACSSDPITAPPRKPCPGGCMSAGAVMVDPATTGTGAGGASSTGSGGQGGGETVTVTGDVVTVNSVDLGTAVPYTKPGTVYVYAYGSSSQELSQPYDGTKFSIDNVTTGENWFRVLPMDTTDPVFPTYSVQNVGAGALQLPLLSTEVFNSIAGAFLQTSPLDAQIIIQVSNGSGPAKGIKAESPGAGEIIYDFGSGSYSKQDGMTGDRGVIVLINMSATSITLTDTATNKIYHPTVHPDPGTATLLALEL